MLAPVVLLALRLQDATVLSSGEVQPDAVALAERVRKAYASLRSLRGTELDPDRPGMDHRRVAYRRDGAILIQEIGPREEGVVREYRAFGDRAVLSSPSNHGGYLWRRIDPAREEPRPWFESSFDAPSGRSALISLVCEASRGEIASGARSIRLDGRRRLEDGSLVERLVVGRVESNPFAHAPSPFEVRTVYSVGVADLLVRRVESLRQPETEDGDMPKFDFPKGEKPRVREFRDLVSDEPIADGTFRFVPEPGMVAVEDRIPDRKEVAPATVAKTALREAIGKLRSLSFLDESTETTTVDSAGGSKTDRKRCRTRFELGGLGLARGELTIDDGPSSLSLVSDGKAVFVRGGHRRTDASYYTSLSLEERVETFDLREEAYRMGRVARSLLAGFLHPALSYGDPGLDGFLPRPARREVGEALDVMVRTTYVRDPQGVPDGGIVVERYLISPKDHLLRAYERDESRQDGDRRVTRTTRERMLSLVPNARTTPARFRLPGGSPPKGA